MMPPGIRHVTDMIRINLIDDYRSATADLVGSNVRVAGVYFPSEVRKAYRQIIGFVPVTKVKVKDAELLNRVSGNIYRNGTISKLMRLVKIALDMPLKEYPHYVRCSARNQNYEDVREKIEVKENRKRGVITERSGDKNFRDSSDRKEYMALLEKEIDLTKPDSEVFNELYKDYLLATGRLRWF